jgi:hypothetical protein
MNVNFICMPCISQDNYSYDLETSQLSFLWIKSFMFTFGYEWAILIKILMMIDWMFLKTLKFQKISKLDIDIIFEWRYHLIHVGVMCFILINHKVNRYLIFWHMNKTPRSGKTECALKLLSIIHNDVLDFSK